MYWFVYFILIYSHIPKLPVPKIVLGHSCKKLLFGVFIDKTSYQSSEHIDLLYSLLGGFFFCWQELSLYMKDKHISSSDRQLNMSK